MVKREWQERANRRIRNFVAIAKALGAEHPITQMMGNLSHGRHNWEPGPSITLEKAIVEASALDGCFHILNLWARDHDRDAQNKMQAIWHKTEA